jgi:purine-binding chemotaxis protein CheW
VKTRHVQTIGGKNLVGFEVAGVCYAIEIQRVREIVRPLPTLVLPHVPDAVIGVVDHRGDVVPIIDLRRRFAVTQQGRDKDVRFIIATRGTRLVGLVVDKVTEVFGAAGTASRDLPQIAAGEQARGIKAVYSHRDKLVFVLDVDRLTAIADEIALPEAGAPQQGAHGSG